MKPNVIRLARFGAFFPLTIAALAATVDAQQPFDGSPWNISNGTIESDAAFNDAVGFPGIAQGANSFTRTGVVLGVVVRFPSSPMSLPPQQYALPSVVIPHV